MSASRVRVLLFVSSIVETIFALELAASGGVFMIGYHLIQGQPVQGALSEDSLQFLPISIRTSSTLLVIGGLCFVRALLMFWVGHLGRRWARGKGSLIILYRASFINLVIDLLLIFSLGVQGYLGNSSFWLSIAGLLVATFIFWCADIERERAGLNSSLF